MHRNLPFYLANRITYKRLSQYWIFQLYNVVVLWVFKSLPSHCNSHVLTTTHFLGISEWCQGAASKTTQGNERGRWMQHGRMLSHIFNTLGLGTATWTGMYLIRLISSIHCSVLRAHAPQSRQSKQRLSSPCGLLPLYPVANQTPTGKTKIPSEAHT